MTDPEPHIPATRRDARAQRARAQQRALAGIRARIPGPVGDRLRARDAAGRQPEPIRVGARRPPVAPTRHDAKAAQLLNPSAPPPRHAGAPVRGHAIAAGAVIVVLGLVSTTAVAVTGPGLSGAPAASPAAIAESGGADGTAAESAAPEAQLTVPLPTPAEVIPAPTVQAAPAMVQACGIPAFVDALAAGDDAAAIAAAGGAETFRRAVAGGALPCVSLGDPARVWVVLNKARQIAPQDYRPASLSIPDGVRSVEGGSLRSDAAAALTAMAAAAEAAGAGEIALGSGFRSFATQQVTYGNQVSAQGAEQADLSSARPGFSEHQSGLAADVVACAGGCGTFDDLAGTAQGQWIVAHAWEYGWITRYQDGYTPVTGYSPEPWHLRYIGPELARAYHDGGWHTLEEFFGLPAAPGYEQ